MGIQQKDIKLLWGRSGNLCAICKIRLSENKEDATDKYPVGEMAHVVAKKEGETRGKSILSSDERDMYSNLILLCPTDHTKIDKDEEGFPVEKLHMMKEVHEQWVERTLLKGTRKELDTSQLVYADVIDSIVDLLQLEMWDDWIGFLASEDPKWQKNTLSHIRKAIRKIASANWSGTYPELENATKSLVLSYQKVLDVLCEHSEFNADASMYFVSRFYKIPEYSEEQYRRWCEWFERYYFWVTTIAKCANWFGDVVRRDINPQFFLLKGKFLIEEGPDEMLQMHTITYNFSEEEKQQFPKAMLDGSYKNK